jgi:glucokinase
LKLHEEWILAGDIGGTKTDLALFSTNGHPRRPQRQVRFPSQQYDSLEEIIIEFLAGEKSNLKQASFGVAGPVVKGIAKITNLPWSIDCLALAEAIQAPVVLVNDMDAIAEMVAHIDPQDQSTLYAGEPVEQGARGIIAPGTGLGEGFLVWAEGRYQSYGTEGGHTDFGPRGDVQLALLDYLQAKYDHVSYERVCSGIGIPNLYTFLRDSGRFEEPAWLAEALSKADDQTPVIAQTALAGGSKLCEATLDLFIAILGSEAGNLALKILATGGMYLAGGIPRHILSWLQKPEFYRSFVSKGRFSDILSRIPLHVVINHDAALIGSAWNAFLELQSHEKIG